MKRIAHSAVISSFTLSVLLTVGCPKKQHEVHPEKKNVIEAVYASAMVRPVDYYEIFPEVSGVLSECSVEPGDLISKGDVLCRVDTRAMSLERDSALLSKRLARSQLMGDSNILSLLEKEVATAEIQMSLSEDIFRRQEQLHAGQATSEAAFQQARLSYDLSREQLARAKQQLKQKRVELETHYAQSALAVERAESTLADFQIISRVNGKIYAVNAEPGEYVSPQRPVVALGSANEFDLEFRVDEIDITRVALDQLIYVELTAYPEKTFKAKVTRIEPAKDEATQTFKVLGQFIERPEQLYLGLSGEASIVISEHKDVITIPFGYLRSDDTVQTKNRGVVKVQPGIRSMSELVIEDGLNASDILVLEE